MESGDLESGDVDVDASEGKRQTEQTYGSVEIYLAPFISGEEINKKIFLHKLF